MAVGWCWGTWRWETRAARTLLIGCTWWWRRLSIGWRPSIRFRRRLDDSHAGLAWFAGAADALSIDRGRIAIGGDSAGGGLAAGLVLLARDRGEVDVYFQMLVYPMLDDRNRTASSHTILEPLVWNRTANLAGWDAYLAGQNGAEDVSAYAAPARATDLAGLPPAYISVGTLDLFLDEDIAYAQALSEAQAPVELHVYPGAFHGSPRLVPEAPISKRWVADELAALGRGAERSGRRPTALSAAGRLFGR